MFSTSHRISWRYNSLFVLALVISMAAFGSTAESSAYVEDENLPNLIPSENTATKVQEAPASDGGLKGYEEYQASERQAAEDTEWNKAVPVGRSTSTISVNDPVAEKQLAAVTSMFSGIFQAAEETDFKSVRLPKNPAEWEELLSKAKFGPEACWTWMFSSTKGLGTFYAGRTWREIGEKDAQSGCRHMAQSYGELAIKSHEGETKGSLGELRAALSIYYGDTEGIYPTHLEELIPKYIKSIPAANTPNHHPSSNHVTYLQRKAPTDTGGWGYVADPHNPDFGTLFVNCTHQDIRHKIWWKF